MMRLAPFVLLPRHEGREVAIAINQIVLLESDPDYPEITYIVLAQHAALSVRVTLPMDEVFNRMRVALEGLD